jgi:threonine aldolase
MEKARLLRKCLGGGMRQAGVLAAAGLIALEEMPARLPADHANAQSLAAGLARIPGVRVSPVATNIVVFDVAKTGRPAADISAGLRERGVLINPISATAMRAVTHYNVGQGHCATAAAALEEVLGQAARTAW